MVERARIFITISGAIPSPRVFKPFGVAVQRQRRTYYTQRG